MISHTLNTTKNMLNMHIISLFYNNRIHRYKVLMQKNIQVLFIQMFKKSIKFNFLYLFILFRTTV